MHHPTNVDATPKSLVRMRLFKSLCLKMSLLFNSVHEAPRLQSQWLIKTAVAFTYKQKHNELQKM